MSPILNGRVILDKDGFLRDERGLRSMPHLTALISVILGVGLVIVGTIAFVYFREGWAVIMQLGTALVGGGTALEGYQTTIESKNQKHHGENNI